MFLKVKLAEIFHKVQLRYFNTTTMSGRATKLVQFHSGGDDYCPLKQCEGLSECIGSNPADGFIIGWRDDIERKSQEGEKRIYAAKMDGETMKVVGEVHLKNDGTIEVNADKDLNIVIIGDCNLKCENITVETKTATLNAETSVDVTTQTATVNASASVNLNTPLTNLGSGGQPIARLNDEVEVYVTRGSSSGTWKGKIISSGVNTSI